MTNEYGMVNAFSTITSLSPNIDKHTEIPIGTAKFFTFIEINNCTAATDIPAITPREIHCINSLGIFKSNPVIFLPII